METDTTKIKILTNFILENSKMVIDRERAGLCTVMGASTEGSFGITIPTELGN